MTDTETVGYARPGFLTNKDREYLQNGPPDDINDYSEKRRRIRQRTRSAFRDFSLVFEELPDKDRKMIFEEVSNPYGFDHLIGKNREGRDLITDLSNLIAFICMGIADHTRVREIPDKGHRFDWFEGVLREGFEKAYSRLGYVLGYVDFEITSADAERMAEEKRYVKSLARSGTVPASDKVKALIDSGEIDPENLREFLVDELDDE